MKKFRWVGGVGVAALAIATMATVAGVGTASAASKKLTVVVTPDGSHTDVDANHNGTNGDAGDYLVENTNVLDAAATNSVGHADTTLTFVDDAGNAVINCTVVLANGNILFEGGLSFSDYLSTGAVVPVTGGTGSYAKARGTATLRDIGGNRAQVAFDLND